MFATKIKIAEQIPERRTVNTITIILAPNF
jgi:hypothetical protein